MDVFTYIVPLFWPGAHHCQSPAVRVGPVTVDYCTHSVVGHIACRFSNPVDLIPVHDQFTASQPDPGTGILEQLTITGRQQAQVALSKSCSPSPIHCMPPSNPSCPANVCPPSQHSPFPCTPTITASPPSQHDHFLQTTKLQATAQLSASFSVSSSPSPQVPLSQSHCLLTTFIPPSLPHPQSPLKLTAASTPPPSGSIDFKT